MAERNWRGLTGGELREAQWMFSGDVAFGSVRIHRGKWAVWQPDDTAMAPNGHVYFPPPIYQADFSTSADGMSFLIHELAHVWQVQSGIWLQMRRVWEGGVYDYGELRGNRALNDYTVEQQASIIADWYRFRHRLSLQHGSGAIGTYEAVVRAAIPVTSR